jgi:hypothetical protein
MEGTIPPLHVGGVQDAVIEPAPTVGAVTLPMLPKDVLVPPVTPKETGLLVLHVRETPVSGIPRMSVTVAFSVVAVPALTVNEVVVGGLFTAARLIDWTGQVVNDTGWLLTPPALAKMRVEPGLFACAVC